MFDTFLFMNAMLFCHVSTSQYFLNFHLIEFLEMLISSPLPHNNWMQQSSEGRVVKRSNLILRSSGITGTTGAEGTPFCHSHMNTHTHKQSRLNAVGEICFWRKEGCRFLSMHSPQRLIIIILLQALFSICRVTEEVSCQWAPLSLAASPGSVHCLTAGRLEMAMNSLLHFFQLPKASASLCSLSHL